MYRMMNLDGSRRVFGLYSVFHRLYFGVFCTLCFMASESDEFQSKRYSYNFVLRFLFSWNDIIDRDRFCDERMGNYNYNENFYFSKTNDSFIEIPAFNSWIERKVLQIDHSWLSHLK